MIGCPRITKNCSAMVPVIVGDPKAPKSCLIAGASVRAELIVMVMAIGTAPPYLVYLIWNLTFVLTPCPCLWPLDPDLSVPAPAGTDN